MDTISLPSFSPRLPDSHKGDYGKVLVIAGSETMIGAPGFVALGALRAGAGLVRIAAPKEIIPAILTVCPYATAFPWTPSRIKDLLAFADEHDAVAIGPGLGMAPAVKRVVLEFLERHPGPLVLDADALNALATLEPSEWPKRRDWSNVVLTPHMGEYMRLMGAVMKRGGAITPPDTDAGSAEAPTPVPTKKPRSLADDDAPSTADGIEIPLEPAAESASETPAEPAAPAAPAAPDRTPLAELLAKGTGTVVVLKGHRSIITDGYRFAINTTGNPAMATAGSGDVLTGIIAALLAGAAGRDNVSRFTPLEAAVVATHIHGLAGDLARDTVIAPNAPVGGLLVTDILNNIPKAALTLLRP